MSHRQPSESDGAAKPRQSGGSASQKPKSPGDQASHNQPQATSTPSSASPLAHTRTWLSLLVIAVCVSALFLVQLIRMNSELNASRSQYISLTNQMFHLAASNESLLRTNQILASSAAELSGKRDRLVKDLNRLSALSNSLSLVAKDLREQITQSQSTLSEYRKDAATSQILSILRSQPDISQSEILRQLQKRMFADKASVGELLEALVSEKKVSKSSGITSTTYRLTEEN